MRVLIRHVSCLLHVPLELLELYEESVVEFLTEEHRELSEYVFGSIFVSFLFNVVYYLFIFSMCSDFL